MWRSAFAAALVTAAAAVAFAQTTLVPTTPVQTNASPAAPPTYICEPVNPEATPEARGLLKKLCAISGKGILSGQHNFPNQRSQDSDKVAALTGKYPAIWGSDFGFTGEED